MGTAWVALAAAASLVCGPAAPGTATRPVLSTAEAAPFTEANYLGWSGPYAAPTADPWQPGPVVPHRPDYVVGSVFTSAFSPVQAAVNAFPSVQAAVNAFPSVQAAVNGAFVAGGTARKYIAVLPGTYTGTVFIPAGSPPLTVYGIGDARLEFSVDASITPAAWAALVNPAGQYTEDDPAWPMYRSCATRTSATAGLCATVVWSQSPDLQLRGLTITNTLLDTVDAGTHQALALRTDADRTQLESMRLIGRQDTFYANAGTAGRIARVLVRDSYIEGDTDFTFGNASAVFDRTTFHVVGSRKPTNGVVFAPSTTPLYPYGFLVRRSRLTTDPGYQGGHFGRAWDQGAGATGYLPGVSPNGQLVIRDSHVAAGFDPATPWAPAATTSRPFTARTDPGRNLDDPTYNRLWEYHNAG